MTVGRGRDLDELGPRLGEWLTARAGAPVRLAAVRHASAGWSNETVLVDYTVGDDPGERREVVRMAPLVATFPDDDLSVQGEVQRAVHALGIPAPAPVRVETDSRWLGATFLVMPFVAGRVPGEVPALDPWIVESPAADQVRLLATFVDTLAAIHRADWRGAGLGRVLRGSAGGLAAELDWWDRYLRWSGGDEPLPALIEGLAWCRQRRPAVEPAPSLLWGDPRLGNLVVGEDRRLRAVLDWDMALIGPAEMDLGWFLALHGAGEELVGKRVAGFWDHDVVVAEYERRLGRGVRDLAWYEVFALVRSLAVSNHQARHARALGLSYATPPDDRNPLVGLLRDRMAAWRS